MHAHQRLTMYSRLTWSIRNEFSWSIECSSIFLVLLYIHYVYTYICANTEASGGYLILSFFFFIKLLLQFFFFHNYYYYYLLTSTILTVKFIQASYVGVSVYIHFEHASYDHSEFNDNKNTKIYIYIKKKKKLNKYKEKK